MYTFLQCLALSKAEKNTCTQHTIIIWKNLGHKQNWVSPHTLSWWMDLSDTMHGTKTAATSLVTITLSLTSLTRWSNKQSHRGWASGNNIALKVHVNIWLYILKIKVIQNHIKNKFSWAFPIYTVPAQVHKDCLGSLKISATASNWHTILYVI